MIYNQLLTKGNIYYLENILTMIVSMSCFNLEVVRG